MNSESLDLRTDALAHAKRLSALTVSVLPGLKANRTDRHRIFLIAQAVRALQYFQAIITLISTGSCEPAGAILRVLLEQIFVFKAVYANPGELNVLVEQSQGESIKSLNALSRLPEDWRPDDLTEDRIQAAIAEIGGGPGKFDAFYWAGRSGLRHHYDTMYRSLSVYSHGSLAAIARYVQMDASGAILGIRNDAAQESAGQFLVDASSIMLDILATLAQETVSRETLEKFEQFANEQRVFYVRIAATMEGEADH